jgi:hypothetical protein
MIMSVEKIKSDEEPKKKQKNRIAGKVILVAKAESEIQRGYSSPGAPNPNPMPSRAHQ